MPSVFTLIGGAWSFAVRQSVIRSAVFWLLILPSTILGIVSAIIARMPMHPALGTLQTLNIVIALFLMTLNYWGIACILIAGKRLLRSAAGRSRTSFSAVRKSASHILLPLLFTDILRITSILLRSFLLIIPGIIELVATMLTPVVMVAEGLMMRPALRRSRAISRGRHLRLLWSAISLTSLLYLPAIVGEVAINRILSEEDAVWLLCIREGIVATFYACATTLFLLSLILLYRECTKKTNA